MTSPIRLAVIMDPIDGIKPAKDSTLAMLLEAQRRGWQIGYAELADISLADGIAHARLAELAVHDDEHDWFEFGASRDEPLGSLDVVLMRKDPPFDMEYIYATYILERAEQAGALVVNRPQALRDANEKVFTAWFADCCAPTLISRSMQEHGSFVEEQGKSVIKPLDGMGGRSVFVVSPHDRNRNVIIETLTEHGLRYAMAQRYLPEIVEQGDKRILLVDGEPVPYGLARIPVSGDNRGNLAAGARAEGRELTERERWICGRVGPALRERGLLFVGLDVIGGYLTEINVTSPTCIRELDRAYDLNIAGLLMDAIERRLQSPRRTVGDLAGR